MSFLDFFRTDNTDETTFFDEGPKIIKRITSTTVNTGGIDTSQFDAHRQGVELSAQKHFDAGTIKIHAGEPGHKLKRNRFGMDKGLFTEDSFFREMDYFSPEQFIRVQEDDSSLGLDVITFPIITGDNDQLDNYLFDGVIEPLTIRSKISFFSIEVPFESHDVRGAVMCGNTDITWASDRIQTIYNFDPSPVEIPFYDQYVDSITFTDDELGQGHVSTPVGYFRNEKIQLSPYVDTRYPRDVSTTSEYDESMIIALSLMSGSTGNYINSTTLKERSATTGWCYDNNVNIGTDSLAFGGMAY
jgi:hypothetical protein